MSADVVRLGEGLLDTITFESATDSMTEFLEISFISEESATRVDTVVDVLLGTGRMVVVTAVD